MRKLLPAAIILCTAYTNAYANDTAPDVFIAACPACECERKPKDGLTSYAGVRVYQNIRATYSYDAPGAATLHNKKDNLGFGTTMGFRLPPFLRGEYETLYMGAQYNAGVQSFEYDIWANMLNAYLYWDIDGVIAPYVGIGAGLTAMWGAIDGNMNNATDFSYQALIGVLFEMGPAIELEFGFKYVDFGEINHGCGTTSVDAAQLYIGAIYRF